mmetsp:Transcript_8047/g.17374  ORF Transcript_8047/g.17374 Transcript_8047/m.17374 type:complete len:1126 (-) Transcript_8047:616-3993(-)
MEVPPQLASKFRVPSRSFADGLDPRQPARIPQRGKQTRSVLETLNPSTVGSRRFSIGHVPPKLCSNTCVDSDEDEDGVVPASEHFPLKVDSAVSLDMIYESQADKLKDLAVANMGRVQRYVNLGSMSTVEGALKMIDTMQESYESGQGVYVGVFFHGELCGQLRLDLVRDSPMDGRRMSLQGPAASKRTGAMKIVYWLGDAFEGSGVLTRAIPAFLEHVVCSVWCNIALTAVLADIKADNVRSKALVTRLGFVKSGVHAGSADEQWIMSLRPGWKDHMAAALQVSRKAGVAQKWRAALEAANIEGRACQETAKVAMEVQAGDMTAWFRLQELKAAAEQRLAELKTAIAGCSPEQSSRVIFASTAVEVPLALLQGWWDQPGGTAVVVSRSVVTGTLANVGLVDGNFWINGMRLSRMRSSILDSSTTFEWEGADESMTWTMQGQDRTGLSHSREKEVALKAVKSNSGVSLLDLQGLWIADGSQPIIVTSSTCLLGRGPAQILEMQTGRWALGGFRLREADDSSIMWETLRGGRLKWEKIPVAELETGPSAADPEEEIQKLQAKIRERSELLDRQQQMLGEAADAATRAMVGKQIQVVEYELTQLQRSLRRLRRPAEGTVDAAQGASDSDNLALRIVEVAAKQLEQRSAELELEVLKDRDEIDKKSGKLKDLELWRAEVARQGDGSRSRARSRMTHIESEIRRVQKEMEELELRTAQRAPAVSALQKAAAACAGLSEDCAKSEQDVIGVKMDLEAYCRERYTRLRKERLARMQQMKEASHEAMELQKRLNEQHLLQAGWCAFGSTFSTGVRGAAYVLQSVLASASGQNGQDPDDSSSQGPAPVHYKALFRNSAATVKAIAAPSKGQSIAMWVNLAPVSEGQRVAIYSDDSGQTICLDHHGILLFEQFRPALCVATTVGISLDFWTHICVVVFPSSADEAARWYINGEVIPVTQNPPRTANLTPVRGELREVQVYAGPVPQESIRSLANFDSLIQEVYHTPSWQIYTQFGLDEDDDLDAQFQSSDILPAAPVVEEEEESISHETLQGRWQSRDGWRREAARDVEVKGVILHWSDGEVQEMVAPSPTSAGEWHRGSWRTCTELSGLPDMVLWTSEDQEGDSIYSWWVRLE